MDFKQLEAFINVVKFSSFSKAADEMFISQPSISIYINSLEKEFGVQLLFRSTKEVFPTSQGKLLYEHAKILLNQKEKAISELLDFEHRHMGELSIMASSVPSQNLLPKILTALNQQYPMITFKIVQTNSDEVIHGILSQNCEIGIAGSIESEQKCVFEHFCTDKLVIITPNKPEFIRGCEEPLSDFLRKFRFVKRENGSGTMKILDNFFNSIGIDGNELKCVAFLNNTEAVIHAVANGLGISLVSKVAAQEYLEFNRIRAIELDSPELSRNFYFVYRKDFKLSPISELFLEFARNSVNI